MVNSNDVKAVKKKYGDNHWWESKDEFTLDLYVWFEPILLTKGDIPRASSEIWDSIMGSMYTTKDDPDAIKRKNMCSGDCNHNWDACGTVDYIKYPLSLLADAPKDRHDLEDILGTKDLYNQKVYRSSFSHIGRDIQYGILLLEKGLKTKPKDTLQFLEKIYDYHIGRFQKSKLPDKKTLLWHISKIKEYWYADKMDNHFGERLKDIEALINLGGNSYLLSPDP